ncbi:MAG: hypothetical protein ACYTHK_16190 [Planctomycetota bacterium]|jgi:hypothetical protein
MTSATRDAVHEWLEEAAGAMGGDANQRREALLELESAIYERIDERTTGGEDESDAARAVLIDMGDAIEIGHRFVPQRPLIAPESTRTFLIYTFALFAVHFVMVIGASLASQAIALGPLRIRPFADSSAPELIARAIEVLLFDAGLMLCCFLLQSRVGRLLPLPRSKAREGKDRRRHVETATFLALVLVVANFVRDNLLALYLPHGEGTLQVPLLGSGFTANLLLFNLWIGLTMLRELVYGWKGNTRPALLLDIVARAIGVFCLLRIVATRKLVDLTAARDALGADTETIASLLNSAFSLIALATAALIAVTLVKRVFRVFTT